MTEYEKMKKGLPFNPGDPEILAEQRVYVEKLREFNSLGPNDITEKQEFMKENFAECGDNCYIEGPVYANWGGHNLHLGSDVYINSNFTAVDDGHIYLGDCVLLGPNVTIATAGHPVDPVQRRQGIQTNEDVRVGENVWLGAGAIVLPGVSIGDNSVIGAGSVVTKDIPANVVAVGNPCRVIRTIGEGDIADPEQ